MPRYALTLMIVVVAGVYLALGAARLAGKKVSFILWITPLALFATATFLYLGVLSDSFYEDLDANEFVVREEVAARMLSLLSARAVAAGSVIFISTLAILSFTISEAIISRATSATSVIRPCIGMAALALITLADAVTSGNAMYMVQTAVWLPAFAGILIALIRVPQKGDQLEYRGLILGCFLFFATTGTAAVGYDYWLLEACVVALEANPDVRGQGFADAYSDAMLYTRRRLGFGALFSLLVTGALVGRPSQRFSGALLRFVIVSLILAVPLFAAFFWSLASTGPMWDIFVDMLASYKHGVIR